MKIRYSLFAIPLLVLGFAAVGRAVPPVKSPPSPAMKDRMVNMGNARAEIDTAITHAGFAAKMKETDQIHLHLHHVVNCLVGPNGKQFDASAGNPCKGKGEGALNDAGADMSLKLQLQRVLDEAEAGLATDKADEAHQSAVKVESLLKETSRSTKMPK
ncbi:MAG: hypothetical protein PVI56_09225 [Gammaproteobacteria bacterium]|jgi:hypothetical protein